MIYFVRCGHDGPVKIGHTRTSLAARLNFLQVGCPWQIHVLCTVDGDRADEARMHQQFQHLHMRGEWFHAAPELLTFIQANAEPVVEAVGGIESIGDMRAALGLTQTALAEKIGVAQGDVSNWENGKHKPSRAARASIARLLAEHEAAPTQGEAA